MEESEVVSPDVGFKHPMQKRTIETPPLTPEFTEAMDESAQTPVALVRPSDEFLVRSQIRLSVENRIKARYDLEGRDGVDSEALDIAREVARLVEASDAFECGRVIEIGYGVGELRESGAPTYPYTEVLLETRQGPVAFRFWGGQVPSGKHLTTSSTPRVFLGEKACAFVSAVDGVNWLTGDNAYLRRKGVSFVSMNRLKLTPDQLSSLVAR